MSSKFILLVYLISMFTEIFPQVSLINESITTVPVIYERIRAVLDRLQQVPRVRTVAQLNVRGNEFATLDFIGLVQRYDGYKAQEYDVQTEDGYILKMHRISSSPHSPPATNKPVVFMMHSLAASSDIFVVLGPKHDLAFMLADAGYDVFLGNFRGTTYSKRHIKYSPESTNYKFWNFNLDDIASKDLPAFIDAALTKSNKRTLSYIGFAVGNTLNYMLLSSKPEYNNKVDLSISLSPFGYFVKPYYLWFQSDLALKPLIPAVPALKLYELLPLTKWYVAFAKTVCKDPVGKYVCALISSPVLSLQNVDVDTMSSIHSVIYNGATLDVAVHISQLESHKKIVKYDYGPKMNQRLYNSTEPPEYDVSKITSPQALFYSVQDTWVNPKAAEKLKNDMQNVVAFEKVPDSYLTYDFIWAKNARTDYYYKILNLLRKYSK